MNNEQKEQNEQHEQAGGCGQPSQAGTFATSRKRQRTVLAQRFEKAGLLLERIQLQHMGGPINIRAVDWDRFNSLLYADYTAKKTLVGNSVFQLMVCMAVSGVDRFLTNNGASFSPRELALQWLQGGLQDLDVSALTDDKAKQKANWHKDYHVGFTRQYNESRQERLNEGGREVLVDICYGYRETLDVNGIVLTHYNDEEMTPEAFADSLSGNTLPVFSDRLRPNVSRLREIYMEACKSLNGTDHRTGSALLKEVIKHVSDGSHNIHGKPMTSADIRVLAILQRDDVKAAIAAVNGAVRERVYAAGAAVEASPAPSLNM